MGERQRQRSRSDLVHKHTFATYTQIRRGISYPPLFLVTDTFAKSVHSILSKCDTFTPIKSIYLSLLLSLSLCSSLPCESRPGESGNWISKGKLGGGGESKTILKSNDYRTLTVFHKVSPVLHCCPRSFPFLPKFSFCYWANVEMTINVEKDCSRAKEEVDGC